MTRSVIRRIEGSIVTGWPCGQARTSSRVADFMASKNPRIRSPFIGGTSTRRCRACASSSSTSTEVRPTLRLRNEFASPECSACGSPRKTSRMASPSMNMTAVPYFIQRTVNGVP
jgi:hypothetical protein